MPKLTLYNQKHPISARSGNQPQEILIMDITHFGYDLAESVEDFFQKVLDWKNENKPSEDTVKTAKKIVEMMQEKPKSLCVFEDTIIIDYDNSTIDVKDNVGEFLFLGKKNATSNQYTQHN